MKTLRDRRPDPGLSITVAHCSGLGSGCAGEVISLESYRKDNKEDGYANRLVYEKGWVPVRIKEKKWDGKQLVDEWVVTAFPGNRLLVA